MGRFVRALVRVVIDLLARASLNLLPKIPAWDLTLWK
jgi:hypothetical protein